MSWKCHGNVMEMSWKLMEIDGNIDGKIDGKVDGKIDVKIDGTLMG